MKEYLPVRIVKMVVELHSRGYTSLYLYCGMSPSGFNWRYSIGALDRGKWPSLLEITSGSLRTNSDVDWAEDSSSVTSLVDGFIKTFKDRLPDTTSDPTEYSLWFSDLVSGLRENELLVFYSDYGGKHQHHLESAPGYARRGL